MTLDTLQRFIFENEPVRGEYIKLDTAYQSVLAQHQYPSIVQNILGEALCMAALLSASIKYDGRLTLQFRGEGKLRMLLAQCDNHNHLRGIAKYDEDITPEDLLQSFNNGKLVMLLDSPKTDQRYQGIVEWKGNSIAASIEHYFQHSEQLTTRIWLNVNDKFAIGYFLQIVPMQAKSNDHFENQMMEPSWHRIVNATETNIAQFIHQFDYPELLTKLYPEDTLRVFAGEKMEFHCGCTRKRGQNAIYVLGRTEAEAELKDKQVIAVTCEFCNKEYLYDRVDIEQIFHGGEQTPPDPHLH